MRMNRVVLLLAILALALVPAVGLACDKDGHAATTTAEANGAPKGDCSQHAADAAEAGQLAANAESGCGHSAAALITMAKESGCPKAAALAAKAEAGDAQAKTALIAMAKTWSEQTQVEQSGATPSMAQLATWAEAGCEKSAAALIEMAKRSGSDKTVKLATKAEGGSAKSMAALIAMAKAQPGTN